MFLRTLFNTSTTMRSLPVDPSSSPLRTLRRVGIATLAGMFWFGDTSIASASSTTIPINTDVKMQGVCGDPNNPNAFSNYYPTQFQFDLGAASSTSATVTKAYDHNCSSGAIDCHPFTDSPTIQNGMIPSIGSGYKVTWSNSNSLDVLLWEVLSERTATKHYGYKVDSALPSAFSHSVVGSYTFWNDRDNNQIRDATETDISCDSVPSQTVSGHAARLVTASLTPLGSVARVAHAAHSGIGCISTILNTKSDAVRLPDDFPFKPKVALRAWSFPVEVTLDRLVATEILANGTPIAPSSVANIAYDAASLTPKLVEICVDVDQSPGAMGFAVAIDWTAKRPPAGSDATSDSPDLSMYVGVPLDVMATTTTATPVPDVTAPDVSREETQWSTYQILMAAAGLLIAIVIALIAVRRK